MNVSLDYKYYLTNVNWTNRYENVMCFANKSARDTYFDLVNVFSNITNTFNFNISNLYKTTIVVDSADYISALQKNYIIICKYDDNDSSNNEYYFYFITNARQCNGNRLELTIELDLYQQYYYDVTFADCPINRTKVSINKLEDGYYRFKGTTADGAACNSEPIDYPLFYKKKYDLYEPSPFFENKFMSFMGDVHGFMYVFVDPTHTFEMKDFSATPVQVSHEIGGYATKPDGAYGIHNNIGVLCFPIYNGTRKIRIKFNSDYYVLQDANSAILSLMAGNSGADAAYIYSVKISRRPPFTQAFIENAITSSTTYITITANGTLDAVNDILYLYEPDTTSSYNGIVRTKDTYNVIRFLVDTNSYYEFTNYIPYTDFNMPSSEYDPTGKLQAAQYTKAYIDFGDGNKMEFELDKARVALSDEYITYKYKEAIVPDITRYTVCLTSSYFDGVSGDGIDVNGQTFTADMSLIYTLDQWASFLANNKNFYAQGNFNATMNFNKQALSGIGAAGALNYLKVGATMANMYADALSFKTNREYQVDNLKESVDRVVNQNGSSAFNLVVKGIKPSIVLYTVESNKVANIVNYLKMFGLNTKGLRGNVKTIMAGNSTGFHYAFIQADVEDLVSGDMSLECEQRFLQIFKDGVRFWYDASKMYDFTY